MTIESLAEPVSPEERDRLKRDPEFDRYLIGIIGAWSLYLNRDQRYLGRSYAWWQGGSHMDLMDLSDLTGRESKALLTEIAPRFKGAVKALWGATHVNYAWLGNEVNVHRGHGHMHLIPRYFDTVPTAFPDKVYARKFPDPNVGRNYAPYDRLVLDDAQLDLIKDELRGAMGFRKI
jgi:diadenosine tetraphosphate (Ap4A) HIT family hydrolase